MHRTRPILAIFAAIALLAGCSSGADPAPEARAELSQGEAGRIGIATAEAYDFPDLAAADGAAQTIAGTLSLPDGDGPVRGTVLLSHGAGGPGSRQERMAGRLTERGYAAIVLDHFGPRGVGSTVRDQLRVTEQTMVGDLFAARELALTHPRLAGRPVGVIGWSKGGTTALLASVDRLAGHASDSRFDFAVAFYPFCGFAFDDERLANPLLMLLGGADDWTPPGPCLRQAEVWEAAGEPVDAVLFEGAPHGFDARTWFDFTIDRAITVRDTSERCTLTVDAGGQSVTVDRAHSVGTLPGRVAFLEECGVRGVTFGGDSAAREAAFERLDAFLAGLED